MKTVLLGLALLASALFAQDTHCPAYPTAVRQADEERLERDRDFFQYQLTEADPDKRVSIPPSSNFIDDLVFAKLRRDGVDAADLTTDSEFVRRVYLDLTGRIPANAVSVRLDVTNLSGSAIGSADVTVPANGQVAMFLNQIPGLGTLPETFQGVVRVSNSSAAFSLVGLRARFNERGDFLITTTRPFDESDPSATSPSLFPHLAVGGGYSTQFILLNVPPAQAQAGLIRFLSSAGDSLSLVLR